MADAKHGLEFLEGGVGMLCDMGAEFRRVEFAPGAPTGFRRQRAFLGRDQIPVDRTPGQGKMPGGRYFGATTLDEFYDPFPQVQRIGFHARKPISQCPNINMKCYIASSDDLTLINLLVSKAGRPTESC